MRIAHAINYLDYEIRYSEIRKYGHSIIENRVELVKEAITICCLNPNNYDLTYERVEDSSLARLAKQRFRIKDADILLKQFTKFLETYQEFL